jgi:hypothetical protein
VTLTIDKLEKTAARSAYCAWAEMTTAVRRDGSEWHKAVWHLQNRSLQFLPVALPAGAELMSARVGGHAVRADAGTIAGRAATLIPLIRTKPGDVSYDVELVWRKVGGALRTTEHREVEDAELIGITVEQTFWNVWLPEDRELKSAEGNMTQVIEVSREVEKGRAALEELKALNKLLASEKLDALTCMTAQSNFDVNSSALNEQVIGNNLKLSQVRKLPLDKKQIEARVNEEVAQLTDLNGMVSVELQRAKEDNAKLVQFNRRRFAEQPGQLGAIQSALQPGFQAPAKTPAGQPAAANGQAEALLFGQQIRQQADVSAPERTAAGVTTGVVNAEDLRWKINPQGGGPKSAAGASVSQTDGTKSNFYLNDNVVWKEDKAAAKLAIPAQKPMGGEKGRGTLENLDKNESLQTSQPAPANQLRVFSSIDDLADRESQRQPEPQQQFRNSSYSRGNKALREEQALQQQAQMPAQPESASAAQLAAPRNFNAPMAVPLPSAPATAPVARPSTPPSEMPRPLTATTPAIRPDADGDRPALAVGGPGQSPTGLETSGRISLAVDFPTEGRVHHFQKVKANAQLELRIADTTPGIRWGMVGLFAGLALMLAALERLGVRRWKQARA